MAVTHQMIQYRLNPDGTVPEFLCKEGMGGIFLKYDPTTAPPQDNIMFGLSEYPVTTDTPGIVGILTTKAELTTYLNEVLAGATQPNPEDPQGEPIPVDIPAQVDWAWGIYQAQNGL